MFDCKCIHKDHKIVLSSLVDDEILRIKTLGEEFPPELKMK